MTETRVLIALLAVLVVAVGAIGGWLVFERQQEKRWVEEHQHCDTLAYLGMNSDFCREQADKKFGRRR